MALPTVALLSGCGPAPPPQIASVAPAPSQGAVHTDTPIVITFTEPMNERSVDFRFRFRTRKGYKAPDCNISRAIAGQPTGCHFQWPSREVMKLVHPGHPFAVVTGYHVQLLGGFSGADGTVNSLSHSWEFSTEGGPQVSSTFPAATGTLGPDQPVAVDFSRDMNLKSVEAGMSLSPAPVGGYQLEANPDIPGRFLLEPVHPLVAGQRYTLSISREVTDIEGDHLKKAVSVPFTVGALGSSTAVVFPAGPSAADLTEVLSAVPPEVAGDPPSLRVLATAPAGQHYAYAWPSPDGSRLAVTLAGDNPIEVTNLGTGKSSAVLGSNSSSAAAWSPDGQQLAFLVGGVLRVYTVASATSVTLSSSPGLVLAGPLSWNPDGAVVAAVAEPAGSASRVALLSPELRAITFLPSSASSSAAQADPVWSPAGSSLAFAVGTSPATSLWLYRPANSTSPISALSRVSALPVSFLDSADVLVQAHDGQLFSVSTTTGQETLVEGESQGEPPITATATATGRELAFTQLRRGYVQLLLANSDGSGLDDLTGFSSHQPLYAGQPTFTGS